MAKPKDPKIIELRIRITEIHGTLYNDLSQYKPYTGTKRLIKLAMMGLSKDSTDVQVRRLHEKDKPPPEKGKGSKTIPSSNITAEFAQPETVPGNTYLINGDSASKMDQTLSFLEF